MTIRDLLDQFTIQGKVVIRSFSKNQYDDLATETFEDFEYKSHYSKLLDLEVTYMYTNTKGYLVIEVVKETD